MERKTIKQHGFTNGQVIRIYEHGTATRPIGVPVIGAVETVAYSGIYITTGESCELFGGVATKFWAEAVTEA